MSEWIKVEDQKPETYQWVLTCTSPRGTNEPRCIHICRWTGKEWTSIQIGSVESSTFTDIIHEFYYDEISHWMSLPKPPEKDEIT